ncbi:hypothetical protein F441_18207 [Phytophthora nicotianae CJ01A1]|uniref:Ubiquitin-like protease family profile domain-containing protein n=1 Tax=Phytophthora nicotianae CJ01A1 TaxID=1317063 RepID=W2W3L6_PHYNI|nr:hypothetical protein F441_18207 [Phytophthora nicotianae CJ01A1]
MEFVKGITSDHDLLELSKRIDVKIDGIYELSEITSPLPKKGSYLILLRTKPGVGHWSAVSDSSYFDSMGVPPPLSLGKLSYFDKQIQGSSDEYCGIYCMLFLHAKQHGKMHLFDRFMDLDIDVI